MELLIGGYDMDVDVYGPDEEIPNVVKWAFYYTSESILSHQPVAIGKLQLEHRFRIAMKLSQRTPREFLETVGLEFGSQLLNLTDERGGNALHWAAKQMSACHSEGPTQAELMVLLTEFIRALVTAGFPVSATDTHGHTPLAYLLGSDLGLHGGHWNVFRPGHADPAQPLSSWGKLLASTGVSMLEYVEQENDLLTSLENNYLVYLLFRGRQLRLDSIALLGQATLTMNVKLVEHIETWEKRPPPGSFAQAHQKPCRVWWDPSEPSYGSDPDPCWQRVNYRIAESSGQLTLAPDSIFDIESDFDRVCFRGSQDDHGVLAAIFRRDQQANDRERSGLVKRRCSVSAVPAMKPFARHGTLASRRPHGHPIIIHRCLSDSKWGFLPHDTRGPPCMWNMCMHGCKGRPDHAAAISKSLLAEAKSPVMDRKRWLAETFPRVFEEVAGES